MIRGIYFVNSKHPVVLHESKQQTQVKGDGVISIKHKNPIQPIAVSEPVGAPILSATPIVQTGNGLDAIKFKTQKKKKLTFVLK